MNNIFKVIKLAKAYHVFIYIISVIIVFTTALELFAPYIIKLIVDQIELQLRKGSGDLQRLYVLIGVLFFSSVLSIVLEAVNQRIGDYAAGRIGKFLTVRFQARSSIN